MGDQGAGGFDCVDAVGLAMHPAYLSGGAQHFLDCVPGSGERPGQASTVRVRALNAYHRDAARVLEGRDELAVSALVSCERRGENHATVRGENRQGMRVSVSVNTCYQFRRLKNRLYGQCVCPLCRCLPTASAESLHRCRQDADGTSTMTVSAGHGTGHAPIRSCAGETHG